MKKIILFLTTIICILSFSFEIDKYEVEHALNNINDSLINETIIYETYYSDFGYKTVYKLHSSLYKDTIHPENIVSSVIFDKNDKLVTYNDLISKEDEIKYTNKIINDIKNDDTKSYFEDIKVDLKKAVIVLDKDEIHFIFQQYELGPYVSGIIEFKYKLKK